MTKTGAPEINWESNDSVTDRIRREIEEMQSQVPLTPVTSEVSVRAFPTIDSPPGLPEPSPKFEREASHGISVYKGMIDKSVVAEAYRSPALSSGVAVGAVHYELSTPSNGAVYNEISIQTDFTLATTLDAIVWEPKVVSTIVEPKIVGVDAKMEFAIRWQESDVVPSRPAAEEYDEMRRKLMKRRLTQATM